MERNLFSLKKNIEVIQTTKLSWVIEIENKLMNLEDRSRRSNLGRVFGECKLLPGRKTGYRH